jgi:hypothetical protein
MQLGGLERVRLEASSLGELVFHRRKGAAFGALVRRREDENRELTAVDILLDEQFVVVAKCGGHFGEQLGFVADERMVVNAETVAGMRRLHEQRIAEAGHGRVHVRLGGDQRVRRRRHPDRVGDILHEGLRYVIQMRRRSGEGERERLEPLHDIDRRNFPLEIAVVEIHENIIAVVRQLLELRVRRQLVECDVVHGMAGKQRREIARRIPVLEVDRGRRVVGLEDADLHALSRRDPRADAAIASSRISRTRVL